MKKGNPVGGLKPQAWSPEISLAFMDEARIDIAYYPSAHRGYNCLTGKKGRDLARKCNELSASLILKYPRRFGAFAAIPMGGDLDDAREEVIYALDVLELDGVVLFTNSNGIYLGDPILRPVFAELQKRKAGLCASKRISRFGCP